MVQIYENPNGHTAFGIATQHNPEFAALNSITAGWADGPITEALGNMELQDKFGGLKSALKQKIADRKYAKGQKQEDILNMLKLEAARRGYNPQNFNNVDTALSGLGRMYEQGVNPLPNFEESVGQGGQYSVPNMTASQSNVPNLANMGVNDEAFLTAATGIDLTGDRQNITKLHKSYVENPNDTTRAALEAAISQLNAKSQERLAKSKRIPTQKNIQADYNMNPENTWMRTLKNLFTSNDKLPEQYNTNLLAHPWAKIDLGEGSNSYKYAEQLTKQQQFINAITKDLDSKGLHPMDKSVLDRFMNMTNFNYNPEVEIPVVNAGGQRFLYNVQTGATIPF